MVDYILVAIGIIFIIVGLLGCIFPIIPGPPLSFIGLLFLHFTGFRDFTSNFLLLMGVVAVVVTIIDYIVPIWGTKKFGGSKAGVWGATLGLIVGIFFFPPIGIIIGPLAGAIIAEVARGKEFSKSFRAGLGSLFGFLLGTGIKLIASGIMTYYFFKELF
ncbi:MAG: DUF456 domain-containing protein [Bacteroidales bacterium]|nr:DUF456 domain-containing protein [Bacteroidales bacterium]